MELNPVVLRNKGVPVELYRVRQDPQGAWELDWDSEASPEPPTETVWVRFTANEIAEVEERFNGVSFVVTEPVLEMVEAVDDDGKPTRVPRPTGEFRQVLRTFNGLEGFQAASEHQPVRTYRDVLALVLHRTATQVGAAMIPEKHPEYTLAVTSAWAMATGTPTEQVGKALEAGRIAMRRENEAAIAKADEELQRLVKELEEPSIPGESGSQPGSETPGPAESVEVSTSSGA